MGKRKHKKDSDQYIRKKIRKLEQKLRRRKSQSTSEDELSSSRAPSAASWHDDYCASNNEPETIDLYESDIETTLRSVVTEVPNSNCTLDKQDKNDVTKKDSTDPQPQLSSDFLNILGDSKIKEISLGPRIPDEVAKRWSRILIDGLNRDHKKELLSTILIPENFQLLKAPLLNQEISTVLTESSKNRDKRLERAQNHLGVGIAGLTSLMSSLMEGKDIDKIEIVKKLSEVGQVLLELHFENSLNRKMLIVPTLDKKFLSITQDVKRDSYLFGENFGDKIKATKAAEKSGLQIRNTNNIGPQPSGSRKYTPQGNWRGPPRQQGQRAARQGGHKQRFPNPYPKRPVQTHAADRSQGPTAMRPTYRQGK